MIGLLLSGLFAMSGSCKTSLLFSQTNLSTILSACACDSSPGSCVREVQNFIELSFAKLVTVMISYG